VRYLFTLPNVSVAYRIGSKAVLLSRFQPGEIAFASSELFSHSVGADGNACAAFSPARAKMNDFRGARMARNRAECRRVARNDDSLLSSPFLKCFIAYRI
jgi:hypothetical protein